jgi:hypothetical protein
MRFANDALAGAVIYAGVNLLLDAGAMARGLRQRPQRLPVYLAQAVMGCITGGLIAWSFDAGELRGVLYRIADYAVVSFPAATRHPRQWHPCST